MRYQETSVEAMTERNEEQTVIEEGIRVSATQMGLRVGVTNVGKRLENGDCCTNTAVNG